MTNRLGEMLAQGRQRLAESRGKRVTREEVAQASGVTHQAIKMWEDGLTRPKPDNLNRAIAFLGLDHNTVWAVYSKTDNPAAVLALNRKGGAVFDSHGDLVYSFHPVGRATGRGRNVPVHGITLGGQREDGGFEFNGKVDEQVQRPPALIGVQAFAMRVANDSMWPKYEEGELVFVFSDRRPVSNDYVVIELLPKSEGEPGSSFIKRLVRWSGSRLIVRQFNPDQEITFSQCEVYKVYRVAQMTDLIPL